MKRLVAVGALLLVAACGSSDPDEPARTPRPTTERTTTAAPADAPAARAVERLMRALDEGDCRTAKRLVVTPSELTCDLVEQSEGSFADEGIDLDETTYEAGAVHDASSTVKITWGNDYPVESYEVQRIGGRWKVVFDSAA